MNFNPVGRRFFSGDSGKAASAYGLPGRGSLAVFSCLAVLLVLLAGCAPHTMPPITSETTQNFHSGKIVWHDLLTPDVEAAKRFYGALFGWSFEDQQGYTLAFKDGKAIAGIVGIDPKDQNKKIASWIIYLSVPNVDQAAGLVREAGGEVVQGPEEMVGRGRYALVKDPQGAALILLRSSSGDPADVAAPGLDTWLWNELWSKDARKSLAFYQKLAGYTASPVYEASGDGDGYWIMLKQGKWRTGIASHPFIEVPSQWVPVIKVRDLKETMVLVKQNGGRMLLEPGHALCRGTVAPVEDPSGAVFMVETWSAPSKGKEG